MMTARPPRSWEVLTATALAAAAVASVFAMLMFVRDLALRHYLLGGGVEGLSPLVVALVRHVRAFDALLYVVIAAYIIGFYWWRRRTEEMLRSIGDTGSPIAVHWTLYAWDLAFGTAFLIRTTAENTGDPAFDLTADAVQAGLRLVGFGCLMVGLWLIREEARRRVAEIGVRLRHEPRPSSIPVRTLLPTAGGDAPAADGEFWARVARAAVDSGADLALLESTGPVANRWLLVPAGGDLAEVRAGLAPGAAVTVYTDPPAAAEPANYAPPPADSYHGFLEDASGALTFRTVSARRVPAFLAEARTARRWALYPVGGPTRLTATLSAEPEGVA